MPNSILFDGTDNGRAPSSRTIKVKIGDVRINGGTQPRVSLNDELIEEYAEIIDQLPPGKATYDGIAYWLYDGFHRYHAFQKAGRDEIPLAVMPGTQRDAVLLSLSANAEHGLRRTNADKRNAVCRVLADAEWAQWSSNKIAEVCRVNHATVDRIRKESQSAEAHLANAQDAGLAAALAQLTDAPPAPPVPVDAKQKAQTSGGTARVVARTDPRTGKTRTYAQDTSRIGKKSADPNAPWAEFNAKMREAISLLRSAVHKVNEAFDIDPQTKQIRCKWAHYFGKTTLNTTGSNGLLKLIRELERGLPHRKAEGNPGFVTVETANVQDVVVRDQSAQRAAA